MPDFARMMERQQVLANFGEFALRSQDLDQILSEACRLVGEALGAGRAKILEVHHAERQLLVRAGVGWNPGIVGNLRLPMEEHSSETFAIEAGEPVITQDISKEDRFNVPPFMKEAGVAALVNVPIFLPGGRTYGLLQVDDTRPRDFGEHEIQFLRTYASILGPVIDRLLMARSLHSSEERFRHTVEAALDYAIFLSDPQDRITDWLPGAQAVFGWTAEEAVGQPSAIVFTPENRERCQDQREIETALKEGVAPNVGWHIRKDGSRVFIEGSTRALRDPDGTLHGFLKIGQDVTERRRAEEQLRENAARLEVLVAEVQHRSRNLLGVIASMAAKTLGEDGAAAAYQARLQALSRAQGLLSEFGSDTAEVGALVRGELEAHTEVRPPKVAVSGPRVHLTVRQVQNFSLAVHELTTNAVKHGALRDGTGQLSVTWTVVRDETGQRLLSLDWTESGVDLQPDRITRRGYGRQLIEKALSYALHARTEFVLGEDGVRCRIQLPLE
ncbi:PAS domain S-box protein [Roseomonas sp. SSH11]|uniref:histidine kinase n=1 Tax=Pararoseomonas baculiformis TaxID=2820812 RepID=A0ABS4AJP2_9PROT|nr:PAS domain S-box protein [Pararoseomonas baculiformis]MBP0447255.1 PAS domain S-box protein [Pararoseomonas baculiformis]